MTDLGLSDSNKNGIKKETASCENCPNERRSGTSWS